MDKNIFDERQRLNQYKYDSHSFFILTFSVIICTVLKFFNPNSITSVNEMILLLFIPSVYFSVATILTSSFCSFSNNKKLNIIMLFDAIATFIFLISFLFFKNAFIDIVKYKFLSDYTAVLLLCISLLISSIAYIIRIKIDKNNT